jgi:hypothetical protein
MASLSATAMAAVPHSGAGMAGGAVSTFRQLGYALGIAVLGQVFRGGLQHGAGAGLAGTLSGGQAGAVIAHSPGLAPVVHGAFAHGLDLMYIVAGCIGAVAGILVIAMLRPRKDRASEPRQSVTANV